MLQNGCYTLVMKENNLELSGNGFGKTNAFLETKYTELGNDYSIDGVHAESCSLIACDVAKLLIEEGGKPYILRVRGQKIDSINTETIQPKRYEGRVSWGGHTVCANDGNVYDPMIGRILSEEDYSKEVFLKPVTLSVFVQPENMKDFLDR